MLDEDNYECGHFYTYTRVGHNPAQHNNSSLAQHKKQEILKWCRTLYARKCAKLEENPVPGTRDESKIRLRKTHSHTSNRRGDKAEKERQDKGQERRPILKGRENCQRKPPPCHQQGGRGEHVPTKTITNVPPPHTKGERAGRKWTSTDRTQKITVLCHSTSILLTQIAPGSERVEIGVNRMKNKKST